MTDNKRNDVPYKIYLSEDEMPKYWYNVRADMKTKPAPLVNPGTGQPMKPEELLPVFCKEATFRLSVSKWVARKAAP